MRTIEEIEKKINLLRSQKEDLNSHGINNSDAMYLAMLSANYTELEAVKKSEESNLIDPSDYITEKPDRLVNPLFDQVRWAEYAVFPEVKKNTLRSFADPVIDRYQPVGMTKADLLQKIHGIDTNPVYHKSFYLNLDDGTEKLWPQTIEDFYDALEKIDYHEVAKFEGKRIIAITSIEIEDEAKSDGETDDTKQAWSPEKKELVEKIEQALESLPKDMSNVKCYTKISPQGVELVKELCLASIKRPHYYDLSQYKRLEDLIADMTTFKGLAFKYLLRAGKKEGEPEAKDITKAIECLQIELDRLNKEKENENKI